MKSLSWLVLSLFCAALQAAESPPSGERQQALRNLVIQDCGSCHGLTLNGGLGPALRPANLAQKSVDYLSIVILDGKPDAAMPPWRALLSPQEARWIAEQLRQGKLR